jgi:hypothetical protein
MANPIKLITILENLQQEADLTGMSRSGGKSNWDHYVVNGFDPTKIFYVERHSDIIDDTKSPISSVEKDDQLNILSTDLKIFGQSKYAKVKKLSDDSIGYLAINVIRKPTTKGKSGDIGGSTSKEFLPEKLGLVGETYDDKNAMITKVTTALERVYGDPKYDEIRNYLTECLGIVSGEITTITETYNKKYTLSRKYQINEVDIKILSKNFGEILAALYILSTNKKAEEVYFAEDINSAFYDFVMTKETGMKEYFSVKSHGGSSTSMSNLNFLLDNFSEKNDLFDRYEDEISVVKSLMNDKTAGKTTLNNIETFFDDVLPDKKKQIIDKLNSISSHQLTSLSQDDLNKWFSDVCSNSDEQSFITTLNGVYDGILGDLGSGPKTTTDILKKMFSSKASKDNGYLYYPMGAYIKEYLNDPKKGYLKVLNILLNYGTYIHQFDVNMYNNSFDIFIGSFKQKQFRFSYNGMSNAPANRPLGFVEA